MATYYGQVKGNRDTTATRTGSKSSGIRASVQSYSGSIIVSLYTGSIEELEKILTGGKEKC